MCIHVFLTVIFVQTHQLSEGENKIRVFSILAIAFEYNFSS